MWRAVFGLKLAITLGLLAWLFSRLDWPRLADHLADSDLLTLAAGTLCIGLQPLIGAARWQLILRSLGQRLPLGAVTRWTYVGVFSNQVLPATVGGDGLRVWLACRAGADVKRALNSVVLDRVAMLLCLAVLVVASLPRLQSLIPAEQLSRLSALIVCGAVIGLVAMMTADRLPAGLLRWRVMRWLSSLACDARTFSSRPASAAP